MAVVPPSPVGALKEIVGDSLRLSPPSIIFAEAFFATLYATPPPKEFTPNFTLSPVEKFDNLLLGV